MVSIEAKVAARLRQVSFEKTNASEPLMTCRKLFKQCRNRDGRLARDQAQQRPEFRLGGTRHKGGVSSEQALIRNVRTCRSDGKGRTQVEGLHKRASTDAEHRGGAVRSSEEARESVQSQGTALSSLRQRSTACGMSR